MEVYSHGSSNRDDLVVEIIELACLAYHVMFVYFCRYRISFFLFSIEL